MDNHDCSASFSSIEEVNNDSDLSQIGNFEESSYPTTELREPDSLIIYHRNPAPGEPTNYSNPSQPFAHIAVHLRLAAAYIGSTTGSDQNPCLIS